MSLNYIIDQQFLPAVSRPSQYIGLETNAFYKDASQADVTVALAYPDTYSVGISHLGTQILYTLLNRMDGVACDRSYCPLPDAQAVMRKISLPLFGWESRSALSEFDIVGFSLGYELCVTNVLTMLDLAGIAIRSNHRRESDPIIIAGDSLADTPEPLADFIDLFLPGDGEVTLPKLVDLVGRMKHAGKPRSEIILEAARTIPSIYAPQFYQPSYNADGTLASLKPTQPGLPEVIERAHLRNLSESPALTAPLVPLSEAIHERVMIEIMRGCPNGCRFCQAGHVRLPLRYRPVEEILEIASSAIAATGYHEISLLSLSTSDYPHLSELIDRLSAEWTPKNVSISLPSLRVDSQLRELPKLTSSVRKGGLTIAAEAGSERLRQVIHKDITEENMIEGVKAAYRAGWKSVKVYFMAGLPGETEQDIVEIFELCKRLSFARKEIDNQKGSISASVSWAVPKPHTPMQWAAMRDAEYFWSVRNRLRELSHRTPISFKFHRIERSVLEAVLCRGDRRVGNAIEAAWKAGACLDSWDEYWDYAKWQRAFEETGIDINFYAHRQIPVDEVSPWSHIKAARSDRFLLAQYEKMK